MAIASLMLFTLLFFGLPALTKATGDPVLLIYDLRKARGWPHPLPSRPTLHMPRGELRLRLILHPAFLKLESWPWCADGLKTEREVLGAVSETINDSGGDFGRGSRA